MYRRRISYRTVGNVSSKIVNQDDIRHRSSACQHQTLAVRAPFEIEDPVVLEIGQLFWISSIDGVS